MRIKNAWVYTENGCFQKQDFLFEDGIIVEETKDKEEMDAEGFYLIPGLVDMHIHGCAGWDFCDGTKEAVRGMARFLAGRGVTAFTPAMMSLPKEEMLQIARNTFSFQKMDGAEFCGIHMEGPFLSSDKKGAQKAAFLKNPDLSFFDEMQTASGGQIRIVGVAPECDGAMDFIQKAADKTLVSVAHTAADYETACRAFACGAGSVTHLWNAMPPFAHREPGIVGAALESDCWVELICDGIHVHPSVVRATFQMFGAERVILVSDGMMAVGLPDGNYHLGGQKVRVDGSRAVLTDGTIAGSVTDLMECMRRAVRFGIPLEHAVRTVTINPARAIGVDKKMGSLAVGKQANFVLLDDSLMVHRVFLCGEEFSLSV